ncbi:MAG: hypothetical protein U1E39_03075 [Planctomycetota bacterium]
MHARARTDGVSTRPDGAFLVVRTPQGVEHRLTPVAAAVWAVADGTRSVDELARAAGERVGGRVDRETVFTALDGLADAGLLTARIAPPAGEMPRRALLRSAAAGLGAIAAGAAFFASARAASAGGDAEQSTKERKEKQELEHAKDKEQRAKEHAEQQAKEDESKEQREKDRAEQHAKEDQEKLVREKQRAEERAKEELAKGG